MTEFVEPFIEPQDYDAFRRLLHSHLPDAQDKWLDLQAEKTLPLVMVGHSVRNVKVDPNEFVRFCNTTGADYTLESLRDFAAAIAEGKNRY